MEGAKPNGGSECRIAGSFARRGAEGGGNGPRAASRPVSFRFRISPCAGARSGKCRAAARVGLPVAEAGKRTGGGAGIRVRNTDRAGRFAFRHTTWFLLLARGDSAAAM